MCGCLLACVHVPTEGRRHLIVNHHVVLRTKLRSSARAACALNCQASSLPPISLSLTAKWFHTNHNEFSRFLIKSALFYILPYICSDFGFWSQSAWETDPYTVFLLRLKSQQLNLLFEQWVNLPSLAALVCSNDTPGWATSQHTRECMLNAPLPILGNIITT